MVDIFGYTDYRKYLEDFFTQKKAQDPSFTYAYIAKKAGFNNKGFAFNLIHGKRHLSTKNSARVSRALKHTRNQAKYFKTLVEFNHTVELHRKKQLFKKLCSITAKGRGLTKIQIINNDQYEFYAKWYHSAIRSLIGLYKFKDDYKWLCKKVVPPITPGQAKKSVELLIRLGLAVKADDGTVALSNVSISTGREATGLGLRNFHFESMDLAKNAIRTLDRDKRNMTSITLGISPDAYRKICDELAICQEKIVNIAVNSPNADKVFQLNFHLFPLSK